MRAAKKYQANRDPTKTESPQGYPDALTLDPFELALVVSIAGQIFQKNHPNVYQQILVELRDLYRDEPGEKLVSVCWRLFSLYRLVQDGALAGWVPHAALDRNQVLPASVIFVAATLPLKTSRGFNPQDFIAALKETSAGK